MIYRMKKIVYLFILAICFGIIGCLVALSLYKGWLPFETKYDTLPVVEEEIKQQRERYAR